jgi:serine/threonine-protein kinase
MATVFLAEDQRLSREVAIKRMHAQSPEEAAKRFRREAHLGASLNHPNIVSVFDIDTDGDDVLIVMEHVPGGTLKDALARGPLPHDAALRVLAGIAAAIDHAHQNGIVHRDVKPANILLDADGRAKLADLGIATAAEVTHITQTGTVLGTAAYMAPERLDGHPGGPAADVYALATVAYEALTGHKARQGRSALEIAHAVMGEPPPDLRVHLPDAPDRAADVLARGMARDPAERPPSAGRLVRELSDAFAGADDEATAVTAALPAGRPQPPRAAVPPPPAGPGPALAPAPRDGGRRWLAPALAAAALLLAVVLVLALTSGGDDTTRSTAAQSSPEPPRQTTTEATTTEQPTTPAAPTRPPEATVRDFYERAAAGDFEGAWKLAGPGAREQLGGYDGMVATLQGLESIEFPTLKAVAQAPDAATVEFDSVATHPDRVDRCTGTVELAAADGEWRIDHLNVNACDRQPRGGAPPSGTPGKGPGGGRPVIPGEHGSGQGKKQKELRWGHERGGWDD